MAIRCPHCESSSAVQILPEAVGPSIEDRADRWTRWAAQCGDCHQSWVIVDRRDDE